MRLRTAKQGVDFGHWELAPEIDPIRKALGPDCATLEFKDFINAVAVLQRNSTTHGVPNSIIAPVCAYFVYVVYRLIILISYLPTILAANATVGDLWRLSTHIAYI
jgi:hypothetical protein